MKGFIFDFFAKISRCFHSNKHTCRIIEIDLSAQEVKFQVKMKLPILKCSISEAVNELNLVSQISAIEACYLGGYYGRILDNNWHNNTMKKVSGVMNFLMKNSTGRYQILYKDRSGNLGIFDRKMQSELIVSPLSIVNDQNLISQFNSSQACYIGILAGLQVRKVSSKNKVADEFNFRIKNKPHLRLVK